MTDFNQFNLPEGLSKSLAAMNYVTPTDIQAKAIPACLAGQDVLASAQTGTGKTGAFAVPIIAKLLEDPSQRAMILTPTRELAEQVFQVILQMVRKHREIQVVLLIGGAPIFKQISRLRKEPQIIIGTPGRIDDHINKRGTLDPSGFTTLVLDEADRMLDMGFGPQLETIVANMPTARQTLMFSATFPKGIKQMSQRYLKDPLRIDVGVKHQLNKNLQHDSIFVEGKMKYKQLVQEIFEREGSMIVFANTKRMCDQLSNQLFKEEGIKAIAMHGDLKQGQRTRVLSGFRNKRYKVLIATDVAARGLDIPHVEHVINYDLPLAPEDYIHRVGRTARAGAQGQALDFVNSQDKSKMAIIKRLLQGEEMDFIKQTMKPAKNNNNKRRRFKPKFGKPGSGSPGSGKPGSRGSKQPGSGKPGAGKPKAGGRFKPKANGSSKPAAGRAFNKKRGK